MTTNAPPLGSLIDKLSVIRDKRRELTKQDDLLSAEYKAIEQTIMDRMRVEGTDRSSSKKATVSISTNTVADVTNWEAFHAFIKKTGHFHLLQRRVSDPAYRELIELAANDKRFAKQLAVAGVQPFIKLSLNLRNI